MPLAAGFRQLPKVQVNGVDRTMPSGHDEPEKGVRHGSDHHARADLLLRTGKRDQLQSLGTRVVTDHQSAIDGAKGACFI